MSSSDSRAAPEPLLGVGLEPKPSCPKLLPEFGSMQAAIDMAERAASEKHRQWQNGRGMARAGQKLARGRALHSRLLAYIEVHDAVFCGLPTPAHVVAVTQIVSRRTEFPDLWDCQATFDACGCSRCFEGLWREARLAELERPNEIADAMQRAEAAGLMLTTWVYPLAGAQHAYCKFEAPKKEPWGTTEQYYTRAFDAGLAMERSIARYHSERVASGDAEQSGRGGL